MQRYTQLCASDRGICDPERRAVGLYQNLLAVPSNDSGETAYPPVLFYTATSDDRSTPAHARKMAARMQAMGYQQAYFYENTEGGHSAAADKQQAAFHSALVSEFMWANRNGKRAFQRKHRFLRVRNAG